VGTQNQLGLLLLQVVVDTFSLVAHQLFFIMRFKVEHVPALTLAILPLIIAYNGHGLFATLFWMVLWHALRLAIVTNRQMAKS